jgi:hypothetical protein
VTLLDDPMYIMLPRDHPMFRSSAKQAMLDVLADVATEFRARRTELALAS